VSGASFASAPRNVRQKGESIMTEHETNLLNYYRIAAKQSRTGEKPEYVPSHVRVIKLVCGDGPFMSSKVYPGDYECDSNQFGAVSVIANDNKPLGLRLDEFEPIKWRKNESA